MIELGEAENDQKVVAEAEAALQAAARPRWRGASSKRCCRARPTPTTPISKSMPAPAAPRARTGPACCCACICAGPSSTATRSSCIEETEGEGAGIKSATIADQGPQRLWLAQDRERRAPAGAHLAVRFQCAAAHLVRQRQGLSGGRRPHQDRHQRERTCAPTSCARAAPAASTSTRPSRRCASRTSRPTSWSMCQQDRSQHRNRAQAWDMLRAKLYEAEMKKREEKAAAEQAAKTDIGWGHQIRSYVLQPYQMVKDLRTGVSTSQHRRRARRRSRRVHGAALAQKAFGGGPGGRGRGVGARVIPPRPEVELRPWVPAYAGTSATKATVRRAASRRAGISADRPPRRRCASRNADAGRSSGRSSRSGR